MIASLELFDVRVSQRFDRREAGSRQLVFFLEGPRAVWQVGDYTECSFTGDVKTTLIRSELDLGDESPFKVHVHPHYVHEHGEERPERRISESVKCIAFTTQSTPAEVSDEELVRTGTRLVEDLCLLASFLSQRRVAWFRYMLQTDHSLEHYVRRGLAAKDEHVYPDEIVIDWERIRDFFRQGIRALRRIREERCDLLLPILYCVRAAEAHHIEEKFTLRFLALEKLKDMFSRTHRLDRILPEARFRDLKRRLSAVVDEVLPVDDQEVPKLLHDKLPELNRPAMRAVLERMLCHYRIEWRDLYPEGADLSLIKTRNALFHSAVDLPPETLEVESHRLRALLERTILRMLGWEDLSRSPRSAERRWMREEAGQTCTPRTVDAPETPSD